MGASAGTLVDLPWTGETPVGGWGGFRESAGLPRSLRRFDDDTIGVTVVFAERHTSYPRIVHGGLVTALVDQVMGDVLAVERGVFALSMSLRVRLLRPLTIGRPYRAVASIRAEAFDVVHVEAQVTDAEGDLHECAGGAFRPIGSEQARHVMGLDETDWQRLKQSFFDV